MDIDDDVEGDWLNENDDKSTDEEADEVKSNSSFIEKTSLKRIYTKEDIPNMFKGAK